MQVIEIKNDLIQVRYDVEQQAFSLGDFLVVSDNNADILAQIIHLETDEDNSLCLAKFILNINQNQTTSFYNGYMPSLDATISPVSKEEIVDFITPLGDGVELGTLINSELPVKLSNTIFEKPLYIQADYSIAVTKLLKLIFNKNNFDKNVLIYDLKGTLGALSDNKFTLGQNFKLPLNTFFIDFIYNNDLNELDVAQKSLVQDILLEIKDYIQTTEKQYIEFSTLLDVVEEQYKEQPSDALILFRNKLIEYKQSSFFADNEEDIENFENAINSQKSIFSVFKLPQNWQKALFSFLIENISQKTLLFAQLSETSIDEMTINNLLNKKHIIPVLISNYSFTLRNILRSKIENLIFFQAIDKINDFPLYSNFLNILFDNNYIVWGEVTNNLSIILSYNYANKSQTQFAQEKQKAVAILQELPQTEEIDTTTTNQTEVIEDNIEESIEDVVEETIVENIDTEEVAEEDFFKELEEDNITDDLTTEETLEEETIEDVIEEVIEEDIVSDEDATEEFIEEVVEEDIVSDEDLVEDTTEEFVNNELNEDIDDDDLDFLQFDDEAENTEIENENSKEEIIEEDIEEDNILEDETDIYPEEDVEDILDEEIEEDYSTDNIEYKEENIEEEENTENLIEEVYQEEQPIVEEPKYQVPIYSTNEQTSQNQELGFMEGNIVYHEKYGRGIIEKIINYGAKTLCSIQFDNIGRRLLDPNLADLKQM